MPADAALSDAGASTGIAARAPGHRAWVRLCHWLIAGTVLTLAYSGVFILMAHPRLYWGAAGNDLMPPLLALPLGPNAHGLPYGEATPFFGHAGGPLTRMRLEEPYNQNSWARSLHFLMAWLLLAGLGAYAGLSLVTGHLRRDLVPRGPELAPRAVWRDLSDHLRLRIAPTAGGPPYGLLQKLAYLAVAFAVLPAAVLSGLAMSPWVSAAFPPIPALFGGFQSARTVHFAALCLILAFLAAHLIMIVLSGPLRQLRAMTWGRAHG